MGNIQRIFTCAFLGSGNGTLYCGRVNFHRPIMSGGKVTTHSTTPTQPIFFSHYHHQFQLKSTQKCYSPLSMSLIPIPVNDLQDILPSPSGKLTPTGDQYVTYLGKTPQQRFNSLFEGASIAFLGSMFAYFISFVIGQFLATLMGVIFVFWPILSPEFKAYQRNWELVGGRDLVDVWMDLDDDIISDGDRVGAYNIPEDKRGLHGAYYVARIVDVCVVDDVRATSDEEYDLSEFNEYTMASDELESLTGIPWKLRLRLSDEKGRGMQVHSRMSEEYLVIEPGMDVVGVLLSTSRKFDKLAGMTDFCVLEVGVDGGAVAATAVAWVGDYPYLDKDNYMRKLNENGILDRLVFNLRDDEANYDDDIDDKKATIDFDSESRGENEEYVNLK